MNALLIEEHPLLRLGLYQMLGSIQCCDQAFALSPAEMAPYESYRGNIDLMIFGMTGDTAHGWRQLDQARELFAPVRILVLADALPLHAPSAESAAGICGCLPKTASLAVLEAAIRLAVSGSQALVMASESASPPAASRLGLPATPSLASSVPLPLPAATGGDPRLSSARTGHHAVLPVHAAPAASMDDEPSYDEAEMLKITPRQYEVLVLLARGYPIKTVSRMLNISVATVKSHACTLYQRLKVRNKGEAVYAALQRGATLDWVNGDEHAARLAPGRREEAARHGADAAVV
ncbi:helix-turn-helix transcriptional regulator [Cupriavidus sp. USMAA2-4]|uniref:Helix-turn-helix transcriptional regulator n=1 Tax=Cupriavidus malaysiensis TaxID=367825 RepID=A0ABN4TUF2_9BURK|nr:MULTISPECIES: response regulator transcription factor [Cupriavidus]AOY95155.1 helix-turn-helix transcriptional regulator [Cupriavidus sp. USMAA2-4]AOZ01946.1 helix-turn-helix transcriptional regulator [Cupriavidus sp. USMAHM13]AOZ08316.1 helix-turn-helix transcriptional regulator [Cupriavidus malaysiensis]